MSPAPIQRNRSRLAIATVASAVALSAPLAALAMTIPAAAAPATTAQAAASAVSGQSLSATQQQATLSYWTPARMKAATPIDVVTANPGAVSPITPADPATRGKPGKSPGGLPEWAAHSSDATGGTAPSAVSPQSFSYPYPDTSFNVTTRQSLTW